MAGGQTARKGQRSSALQRIKELFAEAGSAFSSDPGLSDRLVAMAFRLAMKTRTVLPPDLRKRFCRSCKAFWVPGKTVRIRLSKSRLVFSCLKCKRIRRMPISVSRKP